MLRKDGDYIEWQHLFFSTGINRQTRAGWIGRYGGNEEGLQAKMRPREPRHVDSLQLSYWVQFLEGRLAGHSLISGI